MSRSPACAVDGAQVEALRIALKTGGAAELEQMIALFPKMKSNAEEKHIMMALGALPGADLKRPPELSVGREKKKSVGRGQWSMILQRTGIEVIRALIRLVARRRLRISHLEHPTQFLCSRPCWASVAPVSSVSRSGSCKVAFRASK